MQVPSQLPGFSADFSLKASSDETGFGILRHALLTQSRVYPQDECCGSGTCAGGCVCVTVPFVGRQCHCLGACI
jgi:hypothetical protein